MHVVAVHEHDLPGPARLVAAEAVVDRAEYRKGALPADTVGVFGEDGRHKAPLYVPYRQLLPKGVDNLLCAGRMLGEPDTCDTFRLICPCFVTCEAAGTAAALCAKRGVAPRCLDIDYRQTALRSAGVYIG